jgi:tripartite-type tricarboxylate transporter receptor subunit TctC
VIKMKLSRRQFVHLAAGAAAFLAFPGIAESQGYPTRPITVVVPATAGTAMDVVTRVLAERMRSSLGQPVIIENVTGANGSIATGRVVRAAPDGYTLIVGTWNNFVSNGALYALRYDLVTDFEPVSLLVNISFLVVAKKTVPADSLQEFLAWLKAQGDTATAGTGGVGSSSHVGGVLLQNLTGARFRFIHYRGPGLVHQDLVGERIDWLLSNPTDGLPLLRSENIKAYAVTAPSRAAIAPDIPTVDEAGLPGFYLGSWSGIWAPKGTPETAIARLNAAIVDALADPMARQRLAAIGQEIFPREQQTPEALRAYQRAEIDKWWPIIKAAGIKAE